MLTRVMSCCAGAEAAREAPLGTIATTRAARCTDFMAISSIAPKRLMTEHKFEPGRERDAVLRPRIEFQSLQEDRGPAERVVLRDRDRQREPSRPDHFRKD